MNILHVISGLDPRSGGPSAALVGLPTAKSQVGLDVVVIAGAAGAATPAETQQLSECGVKVQILGRSAWPLAGPRNCRVILGPAVQSADVVHIHGLWEPVLHGAAVLARKMHKPYLIRPCGMLDPWALKQKRLKKTDRKSVV